MTRVEEIERGCHVAGRGLPRFREWFLERDWAQWINRSKLTRSQAIGFPGQTVMERETSDLRDLVIHRTTRRLLGVLLVSTGGD